MGNCAKLEAELQTGEKECMAPHQRVRSVDLADDGVRRARFRNRHENRDAAHAHSRTSSSTHILGNKRWQLTQWMHYHLIGCGDVQGCACSVIDNGILHVASAPRTSIRSITLPSRKESLLCRRSSQAAFVLRLQLRACFSTFRLKAGIGFKSSLELSRREGHMCRTPPNK